MQRTTLDTQNNKIRRLKYWYGPQIATKAGGSIVKIYVPLSASSVNA